MDETRTEQLAGEDGTLFLSCEDIKQENVNDYDEYTHCHDATSCVSETSETEVKIEDEPYDTDEECDEQSDKSSVSLDEPASETVITNQIHARNVSKTPTTKVPNPPQHKYTILTQILGIPQSADQVSNPKTSSPLLEPQPIPTPVTKVTKQNMDKPLKCVICAKGFIRIGHLRKHIQSHEQEKKRYKCSVCDKNYSMAAVLKQHMLIHTGEKPHKCPTCDRRFSDRSSFRKHMLSHSGEKRYKCETCNKGFTCASNLRTHTRTHTGEKPYKCPICFRGFTQNMHLHKHISAHTS